MKIVKDTLQEQKDIYINNNGNNDENAEFNMNNEFTWSCEPNNQLNVCTTSVTEGEVAGVKLV